MGPVQQITATFHGNTFIIAKELKVSRQRKYFCSYFALFERSELRYELTTSHLVRKSNQNLNWAHTSSKKFSDAIDIAWDLSRIFAIEFISPFEIIILPLHREMYKMGPVQQIAATFHGNTFTIFARRLLKGSRQEKYFFNISLCSKGQSWGLNYDLLSSKKNK